MPLLKTLISSALVALSPLQAAAAEKNYAYAFIGSDGQVLRDGGQYAIKSVKIPDAGPYCVLVEKKIPDFDWRGLPVLITSADPGSGATVAATTIFANECDQFENANRFPVTVTIKDRKGDFSHSDFSILIP